MGGFSCVNTRLSFDTEILLPNTNKMQVDRVDNEWKDYDYKVCYKLKLDNDEGYESKRVISKILKLDENNQYGFAMTKPLPTGCIKKEKMPTWRKFNLLLETVEPDDPIGHLFIVDIHFDHKRATQKQILYNEIFLPIIEKRKIIEPSERSVYQLLEQYSETDKTVPRSYHATQKAHATLFSKKYQSLYLEHFRILIFRAG